MLRQRTGPDKVTNFVLEHCGEYLHDWSEIILDSFQPVLLELQLVLYVLIGLFSEPLFTSQQCCQSARLPKGN